VITIPSSTTLCSRSVGLFFTRGVPEPSIHTALLFNTVPGPYPYAQPCSPPNFEFDDSYSTLGTDEQTFPATFPNYEPHGRYPPQSSFYPYSASSRSTPSNITGSRDSRRLPPLSTSLSSQAYGWQQPSYLSQSNGFSGANSSTASYPVAYPANQASSSAYHLRQSYDDLALINPQNRGPNNTFDDLFRLDRYYSLPYGLSSGLSHVPRVPPPRTHSPPPFWPTLPEEPTIKRKRELADSAQLKVLDETYSRTAFPSMEERTALANMLDMSPRSIQIW